MRYEKKVRIVLLEKKDQQKKPGVYKGTYELILPKVIPFRFSR